LPSVALGVYAKDRSGETYSLRVTVSQEESVIAQDLTLLREALRVIRGTADVRYPYQCSAGGAGHCLRLLPGRSEGPRRVCMRSPAEHHISQDYGNLRITSGIEQILPARTRVDHRMWPALGKLLCSQVQHHMRSLMGCPQGVIQVRNHASQGTTQQS